MGKCMIIGCGGVASVAIHKCCQNSDVFEEILIASRTVSKCDALKEKLSGQKNQNPHRAGGRGQRRRTGRADQRFSTRRRAQPRAPLSGFDRDGGVPQATKTHYVDTANYEPPDTAKFEYSWQWAYREKFKEAGICALA